MSNKIQFIELGPIETMEPKYVQVGETTIAINPIVPYEDLFEGIQWAVNYIVDDRPFVSAPLRQIMIDLAIVRKFSNLDFKSFDDFNVTPSNIYEIYDILTRFNVIEKIMDFASKDQITFMKATIIETCQSLVDYRNSAAGIVDIISEKAKDTNTNITDALSMLDDEDKFKNAKKMMELISPEK